MLGLFSWSPVSGGYFFSARDVVDDLGGTAHQGYGDVVRPEGVEVAFGREVFQVKHLRGVVAPYSTHEPEGLWPGGAKVLKDQRDHGNAEASVDEPGFTTSLLYSSGLLQRPFILFTLHFSSYIY